MSESTKELSGRELDIAIAERVMQWPRRDHYDDQDYEDTYFSAYNDGGQIVVFRGGSQRSAERWSPAQSIEAAMQVLDKLRKSGAWCCIEIKSDYHYVWWVALTPAESHGNDVHKPIIAVQGEVLQTVICLAALAAMEQKS